MKLVHLVLVLLILDAAFVSALGIGVSPGNVELVDLVPGESRQVSFLLSTTSPDEVRMVWSAKGDITEWVSGPKDRLLLDSANPLRVSMIITVPQDVPEGVYGGDIVFFGSFAVQSGKDLVSAILPSIRSQVSLGVSSDIKVDCVAGGIFVSDLEDGDGVSFSVMVANKGNVRINPAVEYVIFDSSSQDVGLGSEVLGWVISGETKRFSIGGKESLGEGSYVLRVSISACDMVEEKTFSVGEKGSVIDKGVFVRVQADAAVGSLIPITASFRNTGGREEEAVFIGKVYKDGVLVDVIESDTVRVSAGDLVDLDLVYEPALPGTYEIAGKVMYNGRMSDERELQVVVSRPELPIGTTGGEVTVSHSVLLVLFFLLVILLFLIIFKKRGLKRKKF
ncbi:MAG: hypothetical protein ABIJ21_03750 [Nanoarchaeota archaeon]